MTGKRSRRLNSALLPLGVLALVAGCGGGGAMSNPGGGTTYVPPAGKQMTTATLNLLVPGRRPASARRNPQYVSPYTSYVNVSAVAAGAPSPWPVATSTSIPTPGPVASGASPTPIPVTMTVPVPAGSDQFMVNAYDTGGYLLSGLSTNPVNIAPNGATSVALQLNAAADCVMVNGALGGSFTMKPFENQTGAQTATFTVTPCDADGYAIPAGQYLSNAITFATPAPVSIGVNSSTRRVKSTASGPLTFSQPYITQGGTQTIIVTYPANSNAPLSMSVVPSPLPPALYGGYGSVTVDPLFLALVSNHSAPNDGVSVLVSDVQGTGGITQWSPFIPLSGLYPGAIVGAGPQAGCAQGGQAVVFDTNGPLAITLPTPGPGNPAPVPVATQNPIGSFISPASAAAMDTSCNVYVGDSSSPGGYMYSGPLASSPALLGGPYHTNAQGGPAPITATAWLGGNVYVGLGSPSGYLNNIVNASAPSQSQNTSVGPGTQAMVRYDATTMVIATQDPSQPYPKNDTFLARWNGTPSAMLMPKDTGSSYVIGGMAVDPAGNVWAIVPYSLYEYNPVSGFFKSYSLPSGSTSPSAIAIASNGMIFITDYSANTVSMFNSANITGGLLGNTAQRVGTAYPVGTNPNGVVVVP